MIRSFFIVGILAIIANKYLKSDLHAISFQKYELLPFEINNELQFAEKLFEGEIIGPESIAHNPIDGMIYTGLMDGRIVRFDPSGKDIQLETFVLVNGDQNGTCPLEEKVHGNQYDRYPPDMEPICGRPLGIRFNSKGELFVLESYTGLIKFSADGSHREILVSTIDGEPIHFANDLDIDESTNELFFTISSDRWGRNKVISEIFSGRNCGKFVSYNLETNHVNILQNNIQAIANGVTLSHDQRNVYFVSSHFIYKYDRQSSIVTKVMENLPVMPDNIRRHKNGKTYLVGSGVKHAKPFALLEFLADKPYIREILISILPLWVILKLMPRNGFVVELDLDSANGPKVVHSWQDRSGTITWISEAEEIGDFLYMGSWRESYIARLPTASLSNWSSPDNQH